MSLYSRWHYEYRKKIVLLEDITNNKFLFLREGETYLTLKIDKIEKNKVVISENQNLKQFIVN